MALRGALAPLCVCAGERLECSGSAEHEHAVCAQVSDANNRVCCAANLLCCLCCVDCNALAARAPELMGVMSSILFLLFLYDSLSLFDTAKKARWPRTWQCSPSTSKRHFLRQHPCSQGCSPHLPRPRRRHCRSTRRNCEQKRTNGHLFTKHQVQDPSVAPSCHVLPFSMSSELENRPRDCMQSGHLSHVCVLLHCTSLSQGPATNVLPGTRVKSSRCSRATLY
jgi:hypothetical protein